MIDIQIRVAGQFVEYLAEENETTTPNEIKRANEIVNAILKHMAETGMTGQGVSRVPPMPRDREFPDFGQPG